MNNKKLASPQQRKLFFALGKELGYPPLTLKDHAKAFHKLSTFKDITTDQLTTLIDRLELQKRQLSNS